MKLYPKPKVEYFFDASFVKHPEVVVENDGAEKMLESLSNTAENTKAIREEVGSIRSDLATEVTERKAADTENTAYAKKINCVNLWIAIISLLIAAVSLAVAFFR